MLHRQYMRSLMCLRLRVHSLMRVGRMVLSLRLRLLLELLLLLLLRLLRLLLLLLLLQLLDVRRLWHAITKWYIASVLLLLLGLHIRPSRRRTMLTGQIKSQSRDGVTRVLHGRSRGTSGGLSERARSWVPRCLRGWHLRGLG